jgi:alpha-ribazole phosphatase
MKLWLVRHARPRVAPGVCYGATDLPADARATALQARQLAAVLPPGLPLVHSPLQRCEQLSQALCGLRADLASQPEPRIAEMDFGRWEGRRWSDVPRAEYDAWTADFAGHAVGGGESVQAFLQRVGQALQVTRAGAGATCGEAVWITHAGVIRAVDLLARGVTRVDDAGQWPREAPGHGQWRELWLE